MATDESFLGPARMPFFNNAESVYIDGKEVQSIVITESGAILFEKSETVIENSLKLITEYNVIHDNPTLLFNIVNSNSIYDIDAGEITVDDAVIDIDLSLNAQTINAFYGDPINSNIPITNGRGAISISDTSNPIHYIFQNEENGIYQEVFFYPWGSEENTVTDILKTFEIVYTGSNFSSDGTPYEGEKIYVEFEGYYASFYPTDSSVGFNYSASTEKEYRITMYNVTGLKKNIYYNTYSSMKFYLYEGIQTLYEECFASSDITEIDIPKSVSTMGNKIFAYCTQLTSITLNWTKAEDIITYNSTWTQGISTPPIFTVPTGTRQLYIDKGYPTSKLDEAVLYTDFTFTERNAKSILSKEDGDIAYLDAQLIDSGGNPVTVSGVAIDFYQDNTLLDTIQTDSTGKATYSYTSQGVGDTVFSAGFTISGSYLTKTYSIRDGIYYNPNVISSSTLLNIANIPTNFKASFKVKPIQNTGHSEAGWVEIGSDAQNNIMFGQMSGANRQTGIYIRKNNAYETYQMSSNGVIDWNTETLCEYEYNNGVQKISANNTDVTLTNSSITARSFVRINIAYTGSNSITELLIMPL